MNIAGSLKSLDVVVIAVYLVGVLALGFAVSLRRKHHDDLFLAGRRLRWPSIGLSLLATNITPSMMLASCSVAYDSGMVAANFEWLAWIFLLLLAFVFVPRYLSTGITTMPEFLERRFDTRCRNFLSWYALFTTLVLWLGCGLYAGGLLLSQIVGWPLWASVLALVAVAASFTIAGGLAAVVVTDAAQVILMFAASALLVLVGLHRVGGIDELARHVPPDYWRLFRPAGDPKYPWPAIILGYPVIGIWFWCTDQTIVQRVLGARNLPHAHNGALFAAFLKILTPFVFFIPGIVCLVLHPTLDDPDRAYLTMVTDLFPSGMIGLIVAVLIAALVSTVDSGLNSFSTLFTLDIYQRKLRPNAAPREIVTVGRIATVVAALLAIGCALLLDRFPKNLFDLLQSIIAYFAPPMTVVFVVGTVWKRATPTAAFVTLVLGTVVSLTCGYCELTDWPSQQAWPHYLLLSFYLFVALTALMVLVSLTTPPSYAQPDTATRAPSRAQRPTHRVTYAMIVGWAALAAVMAALYWVFD